MAPPGAGPYDRRVHKGLVGFAAALAIGSFFGVTSPRGPISAIVLPPPPSATEVHVADGPPVPTPGFDAKTLPDPDALPSLNPNQNKAAGWLLAEGPAPTPGDGRRYVTLTFDDGPNPETTPKVLALLEKHHVQATFFFIGKYLDGTTNRAIQSRAAAVAVRDAGHLIGSHTHDHALLTTLVEKKEAAQIDDGITSIERVTGKRPTLFRPPYGQIDPMGEGMLRDRGLDLVMWSIEVGDMKNPDEEAMFSGLVEQIDYAGGGTILLHDIKKTTVRVLARLLDWLDAHAWDAAHPEKVGYVVADWPTFVRATAAHPQPYADRKALEEPRAHGRRKDHPETRAPFPALLGVTLM